MRLRFSILPSYTKLLNSVNVYNPRVGGAEFSECDSVLTLTVKKSAQISLSSKIKLLHLSIDSADIPPTISLLRWI